jgi:hypothetical protein
MLFLIENVFPDRFQMRGAYTEKSVTVLPMKIGDAQRLDEFGRILLENFQHLRCRKFLREIAENMNVVSHATNRD